MVKCSPTLFLKFFFINLLILHYLLKSYDIHVIHYYLHSLLLVSKSCWAALFDVLYNLVVLRRRKTLKFVCKLHFFRHCYLLFVFIIKFLCFLAKIIQINTSFCFLNWFQLLALQVLARCHQNAGVQVDLVVNHWEEDFLYV